MNNIFEFPRAALDGLLRDGMTIMSGGFGLSGNPESLIPEVRASGVKDLTIISNNAGADGFGLWMLLESRQVRKMISSYVGENKLFAEQYLAGELELEFNPQGTLAERFRAGGAGIPAFFTATGVGTVVAEGKPLEEFGGELYLRESWLRADLALVKAWRADTHGNLQFRKTARNFNPAMATAARVTVVEAEELVEAGEIDPDCVHTPGIYVQRVVKSTINAKRIEQRTVRPREPAIRRTLFLLCVFWASAATAAREPVLKQVDLPHSYYWRELYLPQLTTGPSSASFTPDGGALIYSMAGSLWRQAIGSDEAVELTHARAAYDYQPDVAPDGRSVVFDRYDGNAIELWRLDLSTGREQPPL